MGGVEEVMGTESEIQRRKEKLRARVQCAKSFFKHGKRYLAKGFTLEVCEKIMGVPVLLGPWEAFELFVYAQKIPDGGTYLEIGCAKGGSLWCAYLGAKSVGRQINMVGIESYGPLLKENTKDLPNLTLYQMKSDEAVARIRDESVDLVFVDGDHSRGQVFRDIINYREKLKPNGVMMGDNWNADGVKLGIVDAVQNRFELLEGTNFFKIRK